MFVFFKQKTAYEMRISDWSSDVCSSDLPTRRAALVQQGGHRSREILDVEHGKAPATGRPQHQPAGELAEQRQRRAVAGAIDHRRAQRLPAKSARILSQQLRSEEHTSELQSLMRISYAVFCLKKKKQYKHI